MIDPLIYDVQLRLDPQSLAQVQRELNELREKTEVEAQKQQSEAIKMTAEALKSFNTVSREATKAGSDHVASLADLSKRLDESRKELASYTKQQQMGLPMTDADIKRRESLKLEVKSLSAEYNKQQRDALALANTTKGTANTYQDLQAQNKALATEMRKMPLDDTTGKLKAMQAQYNANNDKLKAFDASMGHHQRNVGNYSSALGDLGGKLGGMPGPIGQAGGAFSTFSNILKANPIILVVTVLAGLISTLSRVQVVVDAVTAVFKGLDATLNVVGARVAQLGSGLVSILKGNFSEGINQIKGSFTGLATEIKDVYTAGVQAEQMLQRLARAENSALVQQAILTRDVAEARLKASNADLNTKERLEALDQAAKLNDQLAASERGLARLRLQAAEEKLKTDTDDLQLLTEVAQARANLINVETELFNRQRELSRLRNTLNKKAEEEEEARREAQRKETELLRSTGDRLVQMQDEQLKKREEQRRQDLLNFAKTEKEKTERARIEAQHQAEIDARLAQEKLALQKNFYTIATSLANGFFGANKGIAIATAIIDTIAGAQSAYKDTPGGIFAKTVAATAALAQGYARVRAIERTSPKSGSAGSVSASAGTSAPRTSPPPRPSRPELPRESFGEVDTIGASLSPQRPPVVIITGELDSELLAIKVRHGSDALSSRGITIGG